MSAPQLAYQPGTEVRVVTAEDWPDVAAVFATPGDPRRCWCQWFRLRGAAFDAAPTARRRAALRAQCEDDAPGPGVLARVAGVPAGWAAVAPRAGYPRLVASPLLRRLPAAAERDDGPGAAPRGDVPRGDGVWAVPCFVVRPEFRSRGLSLALLEGAVGYARSAGARVVEGYPVDVAASAGVSASRLYHGARSTFLAAGFAEIARPRPDRPIMRLVLGPADTLDP